MGSTVVRCGVAQSMRSVLVVLFLLVTAPTVSHAGDSERARAIEATQTARSEAERVVSQEATRLVALQTQVKDLRAEVQEQRSEFKERRDAIYGWQRRVKAAKVSGPAAADAMYSALRRTLRASRDELATVLRAVNTDHSRIPALGPDPLGDVPPDVATEAVERQRAAVQQAINEARAVERVARDERAAVLLNEIHILNEERLGLLSSLSPDKRQAITGFTAAGWDQARSELRHLTLIFRYHRHVAHAWLTKILTGRGGHTRLAQKDLNFVPVLLVAIAFLWARRSGPALLHWGTTRLAANDRMARRSTPSLGLRFLRVLSKIHRPLEWILLCIAVFFSLPSEARQLLEVQLVASVAAWTLAGTLVIHLVNALAADHAATLVAVDETQSGRLRLRSLRLVGLTIVVFALSLRLSARLVGKGTINSWVFTSCWFAAVPVFLLLVWWWRDFVFSRFDRLDAVSKKAPLASWILAHRGGYGSFVAAMVGAVQLFLHGANKLVRSWVSSFVLARHIHAYFFQREIERIGEGQAQFVLSPLGGEAFAQLDPEMPFGTWHPCPADELREKLARRAIARQGGVVAIVAARGMGKSSLLKAAAAHLSATRVVQCSASTAVSDLHEGADSAPLVLLDDAHTLIEARIGGLAKFDQVLAFARAHSDGRTWAFAIDASVWPLLKRARDARPMFDEIHVLPPWSEEQLGELIAERCRTGGVVLHFDGLLDRLPPGADELDRQDAIRAKRTGYERMLWDHVGGNPGLALQAWRASLGEDSQQLVHVRPLQVPDITKLENLPDSSLFVLRAVLQLAPTTVDTVAQATRLRPEQVMLDLSFGKAQGFYEEQPTGVRISWPWLRAASRLLERRHLLVNV